MQILLSNYRLPDDDGRAIIDAIRRGKIARVVTDQSFKDKKGTSAVKIYAGTRMTKCITAVTWSSGQNFE